MALDAVICIKLKCINNNYKQQKMKKNYITLTLMLLFSTFAASELNAQSDAFFTTNYTLDERNGTGEGLTFNGFTPNDLPLGSGMLIMSATGLLYLISKNRKENK